MRVGRIGPHGVALARALAVLGDDTPLRLAAGLANLSIEDASTSADALAAAEILLARESLRFVHPLVRHAIENDIPASELAGRHLDAARRLWADGSGSERVAAHLLLGRAEGSAWVVDQLRTAAQEARVRSAPQSAIRYLERAVQEPPGLELLSDVLGELGEAEAAAGRDSAAEHLEQAAAASPDPYRRAQLALQQGHALYYESRYERAAIVYDRGIAELTASERGGPEARELGDELQTGFAVAAAIVDRLRPQALERSAQLLDRAVASGSPTHGQRLLLSQAALHASLAGEPASRVIELAERGWDSGRLLRRDLGDGIAWLLLASSICMSGDLERSIQIADQVLAEAQRRGSPLAFATASYFRGNARALAGASHRSPGRPRAGPRRPALRLAAVRALGSGQLLPVPDRDRRARSRRACAVRGRAARAGYRPGGCAPAVRAGRAPARPGSPARGVRDRAHRRRARSSAPWPCGPTARGGAPRPRRRWRWASVSRRARWPARRSS